MTAPHWTDDLIRLGACSEAVEWAKSYPDLAAAWAECNQPRWMMWLAGRLADRDSPERRALVLCLCEIVRTVLHLVPQGEERPRVAIETAEAWARGGPDAPDTTQVRADAYAAATAAADAADAAAYAADADAAATAAAYAAATAAAYAADAAADAAAYAAATAAADAADAAAYAAYAAAYAAATAAYAAYAADAAADAYAAATAAATAAALEIILRHYPNPPRITP